MPNIEQSIKPGMSVVVPAHGRLDLLAETLESLIAQTTDDFELIVSDDSPNSETRASTKALVEQYGVRTGRSFTYLSGRANLGISRNTNQGLAAAHGLAVRQLHSDDLLAPTAIEDELSLLADDDLDLGVLFHIPVGYDSPPRWARPTLCIVDPGHLLRTMLPFHTPVPSTITVRRSVLEEVGYLDTSLTFIMDWELVSRLLLHERAAGRQIGYLTPGLVCYRLHDASETRSSDGWRRHFVEHARCTQRLTRTTKHDSDLWRTTSTREFKARSLRYRYRRLNEDIGSLPARDKAKLWRPLLTCLANPASLAQAPALAIRVGAGLLERRTRATTSRSALVSGETTWQELVPPDVDVLPDVWLYDDELMPSTRLCVSFGEELDLSPSAPVLAAAHVVRCWHADEHLAEVCVVSEVARHLPPGAYLELLGNDGTPHWTSHAHRTMAVAGLADGFRFCDSGIREDGRACARFQRIRPAGVGE